MLFERGAFTAADTSATAAALMAFSVGLPAYVLIKVLVPGFFAREDTATPVKVAAVCVVANVLIILALIGPLAHVGIALATALSNCDQRHAAHRHPAPARPSATRRAAASGGAADRAGDAGDGGRVAARRPAAADGTQPSLALAVTILIGAAVYGVAAVRLGAADLADLRRQLSRRGPAVEPGA